ncbi:hypothetical protein VTL71DRAFT_11360 [Oculimacula yallundae]|uniref:2EXR domain-containing protein n=1 Tax=Oculimacula yallundae TaxID=86028 RepID=A0ABR4CR12_9HELO
MDTFHPFPRLPKELRIKIWKHYLHPLQPRVLAIHNRTSDGTLPDHLHFFSPDPVPALLNVCQESREVALPFYTKAFANGVNPRYVWTNFSLDTFEMNAFDILYIHDDDKSRIEKLILEASDSGWFEDSQREEFEPMGRLRWLRIISIEPLWKWDELINYMREDLMESFAHDPNYVLPDIRILQKGTDEEMNIDNYEEVTRIGRERFMAEYAARTDIEPVNREWWVRS